MTDQQVERNKWREQAILYAPLLLWIGVIFLLSSSQGASTRTSLIIRPILEFLFPAATEETLQLYHGFIRKCAHLTEYAVLGLLACRAFVKLSVPSLRKRFYLVAAVVVLVVAATDEFSQSFDPARTGSAMDVLIDVAGGLASIGLYRYFSCSKARHASRSDGVP